MLALRQVLSVPYLYGVFLLDQLFAMNVQTDYCHGNQ